jgi:hypothetical protein
MGIQNTVAISLILGVFATYSTSASASLCVEDDWETCVAHHIAQGRHDSAFIALLPFAKKGNAEAQIGLALLISAGHGLDNAKKADQRTREKLALPWVERAAASNHRDALNWLADGYKFGWFGFAKDASLSQCIRVIAPQGSGSVEKCRQAPKQN